MYDCESCQLLRSVKGEAGESEHPTDDEALFEGDSGGVAMVDIGNDFVDDDDIHFEIIFQWLPGSWTNACSGHIWVQ